MASLEALKATMVSREERIAARSVARAPRVVRSEKVSSSARTHRNVHGDGTGHRPAVNASPTAPAGADPLHCTRESSENGMV